MQSKRLLWCSLGALLAPLFGAFAARAEPPPSQLPLAWDAPAECAGGPQVLAQLTALLPAGVKPKPGQSARARISRGDDGRWQLELELRSNGSADVRELVGDSCQSLVDSVAVILAMQLERAAEAPQRAAPPPAAPPPVPQVAPPRVEPQRSFLQVGGGPSVDSTALPRLALGGRVDVGFRYARWYVGASGALWLNQSQAVAADHGRAELGWFAGSLWGCHASWGQALRVGPCVAIEVGQLRARSEDVRVPGAVAEPWLAGLGGVAFWLPLGSRLLLTSNVVAVVPVHRPRFAIEGVGEVHQPRAVGVRSALGLALQF